jgi:hypothetical protein
VTGVQTCALPISIRLNGKELAVPDHPYENYRDFTEMQITEGFVGGENVLEFEVSNGREKPEPGELSGLGLRVELHGSVIQGEKTSRDASKNSATPNPRKDRQ